MMATRDRELSIRNLRLCCVVVGVALALTGCGGSSSGNKQAAGTTGTSTSPVAPNSTGTPADSTASGSGSGALGTVDACEMLTPDDFAAATDKVQPSGFPPSKYTLTTEKVQTDVSPATDQHAACTYHFSGSPGASGEVTLDVMTAAEYHTLGQFDTAKPISGLGDEAAVFGERPAFRLGNRGALLANSSSTLAFGKALLQRLASHF